MAGDEYKVGSIAASFGAETSGKKAKKAAAAPAPTNALASFFSTSEKLFAKKPEPKVVARVVVPVVKAAKAQETADAPKAPKVVLFDGEGPKKVKKPKHSKVKPEAKVEAAPKEEEDDEKAPRTIFVGNVSLEATAEELKKFFSSCGKVESARLRSVPVAGCAVDQHGKQNLVKKVCANKKLFVEGRDNCNAYVVFASEDSIAAALALNGADFHEKKIRVDRKVLTTDPKRTVFVGNMAFTATEDEIRNHFESNLEKDDEDEGSALVESVRIIRDKDTHLGKGFGYVLLKDVTTAAKALKLDGSKIGKRELRVSVCGKRFKTTATDKTARPFEGRRAKPAPGAQMRVMKKRKLDGDSSKPAFVKKPKFDGKKADGKKPAFTKTDGKKPFEKKPFGKSKPVGKKGDKKFAKGEKKTFEKPKKPKHAARKARQALEAQMAAAK